MGEISPGRDFIGQTKQMLKNILAVVVEAGGTADITRRNWFVVDKKEYVARQPEIGKDYSRLVGRHVPALTMVVAAGLVED